MSDPESVFEVGSIEDKQVVDGKVKYLVHWQGYSHAEDTWEPAGNLDSARELVEAFEAAHKPRKRLRKGSPLLMYNDLSSESEEEPYSRRKRRPRRRAARAEEELDIVEVRKRGEELVWTVETLGVHVETSLKELKRRAPLTLIDFLVAKMKFA